MMKSFRNLILSLFLAAGAAGLAACEGERGPVGETGPTGVAGAAGPKGAAGDPGRSSDEIPSAYDFLKAWGKADGMVACNDDIFSKKAPFPGPETLTKATKAADKRPVAAQVNPVVAYDNPSVDTATENEGACSNKVFADTITGAGNPSESKPFMFTPTHGGTADRTVERTKGTTPVLRNPTQTSTISNFYGGTFWVDLSAEAAEAEGMDRLAVRCDGMKRPVDVTGGKRVAGEYRIVLMNIIERLLERDSADGLLKFKPKSGAGPNTKLYSRTAFTTQICFRFDSVPGTVKCYVRQYNGKRDPKTDQVILHPPTAGGGQANTELVSVTDEHIAFYKDGKFVRTAPMPINNFLLGKEAASVANAFPEFPFGTTIGNLDSTSKLCNLFIDGVNPCDTGKVPDYRGRCLQAP